MGFFVRVDLDLLPEIRCWQRGMERIVNVEVLVIKVVGVGSPSVLKLASRPYAARKE